MTIPQPNRRHGDAGTRRRGDTRTLRVALCSLLFALLTCFSAGGSEKYAGEFLNLGVGARPLGMGGSFVAVADDATATYWNPAGLGGLDRTEITFMHAGIFGLDSYDFLNYVQPLSGIGTFGLSWIRLGIDDIPRTTLRSSGNMSASNRPYIFSYMQNTENAFMLSYGRRFRADIPIGAYQSKGTDLQIGGNVKFLYNSVSRVNRNAIGFGGDVGLIWKTSFVSGGDNAKAGDLSLGIAVQDFFKTRIFWNTTSSPSHTDFIPPNFKMGVAYSRQVPSIASQILLSIDADTRYGLDMHYGAEYVLGDVLSLRIGVQERNLTAGAGLHVAFVRGESSLSFLVDYAFLSHELGSTHRVSLMTKF
ncbi:MAG: PorV/PorQ family protein, partial [bacterium]